MFRDGNIVGHVPGELSRIFWLFLKHEGNIECEVTGRRKCEKGLEVPFSYRLKGSASMVETTRELC